MRISFLILMTIAATARAQTVAYWRFEDGADKQQVAATQPIRDFSGNGNDLQTANENTAPRFSTTIPSATVTQTGEPNHLALDNTAAPSARLPTRDLYTVHEGGGTDLNTVPLAQWTVEASVMFTPVANWQRRFQTFVGREGYNVPERPADHEDPLANLGFKKRGDTNQLSIEAFDSTGTYVIVQGAKPVEPDVWYHVAAVSDGTKLALYVKGPGDPEYVRQAEAPFHGPLANSGRYWTVGRGCFTDYPTEQFFGLIDEVRISASALSAPEFLTSPPHASSPRVPLPVPATAAVPSLPQRDPSPISPKIIHVHDPSIILAGDTYHLFASHEGYVHWRSKNLIDWERLPGVFTGPPEWAKRDIHPQPGMWAPDIVRFNGKYHLYYSISRWGSQRSAIGLAVNETLDPEDPKYKWTDKGKVIESFRGDDYNCIDATVTLDAQGQPWIAWGSFNKGIYARRLDVETGMLSDEETRIYHLAARTGTTAIEAPYLFSHDGWYFLCVSYDFCARGVRSTYKLMIGRSRDITGPYVDREGRPMLEGNASLLLRSHEYQIGPGQASVVQQGDHEVLAHHYYDGRNNGFPALAVRPLYWDGQGWPLVGEPLVEQGPPAPDKTLASKWIEWDDYGKTLAIELRADRTASGPLGRGRWNQQADNLTITWPAHDGAASSEDHCFVAPDHDSYVGRRSSGTIVRAIRCAP